MATILTTFYSLFFSIFAILASIILLSMFSLIEANNFGFSVDLIHRDSPDSPFYNSSLTHFDRVIKALRRSHSHVNYFTSASMSPQSASSEVIPSDGSYLMKITVGTPPFNILAIADTGSDLTWTQCWPCRNCYKQKAPPFNPKSSSTYKEVSCHSNLCQTAGARSSCCNNETCQYSLSYGDMSYSQGVVAIDTITLGSTNGQPTSFSGIIFGCGFSNAGTFNDKGSGIVDLGGGTVSLISQMNSSIGGKFSYCLMPMSSQSAKSSQMHFGDNGVLSGNGVSDDRSWKFTSSPNAFGASGNGNIIIDSGTTLTYLPLDLYEKLEWTVKSAIGLQNVYDPAGILSLCYMVSNNITIPIITAHFTGADVKLNPMNTFIRTSDNIVCLAFAFAPANIAIYGNVAQMNFLVGYDLSKKTVSFKHTDCGRVL
ncbi:Aspartic proteinase CDR1 [Camellia lanceoleosa]|uniref:Aspartic proteinase CDR1 n=1 Tax=Camellia lanceoleosa TaxID=1840588 RepID=A0ACC0IJG3_9ERIC|nr:Aspartic proteinase CDR1 [Camellia lanceoleosa]